MIFSMLNVSMMDLDNRQIQYKVIIVHAGVQLRELNVLLDYILFQWVLAPYYP